MSIADGILKLGGDPTRLAEVRLSPGAFRCYLELHIEQGATLYKANVPIGVVEGSALTGTMWRFAALPIMPEPRR